MRSFENFGQGVAGDEAAYFIEELPDSDLFARELRDPLVFAEKPKSAGPIAEMKKSAPRMPWSQKKSRRS